MNTKTKMRLLSLLLCLVMLLGILPLSAFAEGRTVVSEITATTPSGEIAPVYGEEMPFIELTVTSGKMISIPGSMYFWQKLNGSNWEQQTPGAKFHEGTYRYSAQFRIDGDYGTTHKFNSENVTVTVDGVTWETERIAVDTDFSYVFAYSPAFVVELSEGEDPIEPITDLTATVTEPVAGEKPDLEPEPGSTDYSVRVDGWFEGGNLLEFDFGTEITDPENYTFKADENYILVVRFQCENEAKEIVEEAQATINGIPAVSLGGGYFATSFGDTTVVDIEIKNGAAPSEFTDTQSRALSLLEYNELLVWDEELPICFDSEGKTLFAIIRNTIVLAKDVTADDNFIYTLTLEERAEAYALFGVDMTQIHVTFNNESDEDSVITIEMETGNNMADYTDDQHQGRGILVDKGLLSYDEDLDIWTDSEGKTLFSIDDSGLVAVADGVTAEDNIVYELSLEDQIYTGIIASEIRLVFVPTAATTIDTIDIGGLAKPVVGEMPDNSITVNGTGVTVGDDGSYWGRFDSTRFNPYYDDDTAVDGVVFRDGETYMFQLYLYAEDGYEFTEDTEFYFAGKLLPAPDMDDLSKSFAMVNPDDRTVAVVYINMNDIAHEHVAGDWEHNDTHHWHKCTASGCDAGSDLTKLPDYAEHSFVGGICTCGAHQHNWSAEWSVNETHHWHECTADGCTATDNSGKAGYAAHNFIGGVCECGVENVITSIEIGSITAPVVGETPVNSASVDKMGAKVDEDGTFWVRYDPSTGRTTDTYADGTFVYNTPFREGEIYLLQITIDLESGYSFAANVKILYKGDELPAPDAANPTASCAAIAPDGSLAMALINPTGASAPVTYTVTFDANGGTGTMAPATGVSGEYTLPACTFTAPSGKQFRAWSVDGAEKAVGDKIAVTADTTVSAVWEDIPHTCTLTPVAKVEPTCTEGGKEAYFKCDECGKCYEDENGKSEIADINTWGNIEASGHTESDWITSDSEHWKECTVEDCGREIADSRAEHADNDGDGKCDTCESTLAQPPKTGDHTVLILLGALVSGALLTLLGARKRKEDN